MPNRSEIQAFLRSIGCESAASDQAQLCLVEKVVEALGEPTAEMIAEGLRRYPMADAERVSQSFTAMWAARFRGE